jgi:hypothetical protein
MSSAFRLTYGLYAKLGFQKIDMVKTVVNGELVGKYPAM